MYEFRADRAPTANDDAREGDIHEVEAFLRAEEDTAPAGTRYYDVDGALVRWRPGRQPECCGATPGGPTPS